MNIYESLVAHPVDPGLTVLWGREIGGPGTDKWCQPDPQLPSFRFRNKSPALWFSFLDEIDVVYLEAPAGGRVVLWENCFIMEIGILGFYHCAGKFIDEDAEKGRALDPILGENN